MTTSTSARRASGSGWFTFAGIMFILSGVSNLFWGIGALDTKDYLPENGLLVENLSLWGWVSIIWGAGALATAWLLLTRHESGPGLAMIMATLSALFWLFAIPVQPIWSLTIIAIDVLIIYQLSTNLDNVFGR
jgi:hypothetical protein